MNLKLAIHGISYAAGTSSVPLFILYVFNEQHGFSPPRAKRLQQRLFLSFAYASSNLTRSCVRNFSPDVNQSHLLVGEKVL